MTQTHPPTTTRTASPTPSEPAPSLAGAFLMALAPLAVLAAASTPGFAMGAAAASAVFVAHARFR